MGFSPEQNQPQQQTQHIIVQPEIHIDPPAQDYSWMWTGVIVPLIIAYFVYRKRNDKGK